MSRSTRSWFAALVHAHHAAVYSAARRIVRSDADAEDVTQQVYLRA
ncbi:MAG: RNA polymerase sigma factor, partial [Planctomycetes bacterium]|nr:RNA polymerase sigma factor [Planctomycetota bacterium]